MVKLCNLISAGKVGIVVVFLVKGCISAYFTASKRINISELRKYLSNSLPKYMIPSYFTVLEDFSYTPNGKINKKALPLPKEILDSDSKREYIAPKTKLEKQIVSIWEQILNISPIGVTDNFFELGGDSILAMNLNIELKNIIDNVSYADIFKFPTISELISKAKDEDYDFKYMEKNYDKYSDLLNLKNKVPKIFDLKYINSGNVILTGATGFLGMHILDNYIKFLSPIKYRRQKNCFLFNFYISYSAGTIIFTTVFPSLLARLIP